MSASGASDEEIQVTNSAHAIGTATSVSPGSKIQTAWKSVRSNFKARRSMPDLKRWLSYPRASESSNQREQRRPEDEEQSLFCDSLLALMQRTGRFDYLDYRKSTTERAEQEDETIETAQKDGEKSPIKRLKRFSWSR